MVVTHDADLAERLRLWRNHGMRGRYDHVMVGTNAKATDLAAAIALVQLTKLDVAGDRRGANATRLSAGLSDASGLCVPLVPPTRVHAWHQYTVRFPTGRDRIARELSARGIGNEVYYRTPIHRQPYLRDHSHRVAGHLSVTERLANEVLSLPVRPNLTDQELERVIVATNDVVRT